MELEMSTDLGGFVHYALVDILRSGIPRYSTPFLVGEESMVARDQRLGDLDEVMSSLIE